MKHILASVFIMMASNIIAQEPDKPVNIWASPSVTGMNLGKGIVFGYQRMAPYNIVSNSQEPAYVESSAAEIDRVSNKVFKLRLPFLRKERTQAVVGFEYNVDEFEFEHPEALDYPFYNKMHQRNLASRGLKFYINHSISDRKFLFSRISFELNGDIPEKLNFESFKYSLAGSYGWKLDPMTAWGVGFYFSYNFGSPLLLPAIMYNKTWNSRWGLESLFPSMVQLRYSPNESNFLYFGYEVFGASYNVDFGSTLNEDFYNVQVRRSEILPMIRFEKEIYDFIWMSIEGGYRYNINFRISEDRIFNENDILINEVDPGAYVGASLFIIPTESLKRFFTKKQKE